MHDFLVDESNYVFFFFFGFAEAITDAPTEIHKTVGRQSKCKDQMKTPPFLRSHTEEHTLVSMAANRFHNQHRQKNMNTNQTTIATIIKKAQVSIMSIWTIRKLHLLSLFRHHHLDA